MSKYIIYNHGGSENHGCEALVRTVCNMIGDEHELYSESPEQDIKYGISDFIHIKSACSDYSKLSIAFICSYLRLKINGDYFFMDTLTYRKAIKEMPDDTIELSIGGDIYCYEDYPKYIQLHRMIAKTHKSILVGCSLEKELFDSPEFVADMKLYNLITARESLTYQYLINAGIHNVKLIPDSAFTLKKEYLDFPIGFNTDNIVGINISPLVLRKEAQQGIIIKNFTTLIRYILDNTDYTVALIPHVIWKDNDDREVLKKLYDEVEKSNRVVLINDCNCMQLKGFISRCRFFIGARTHATIAAYSTCVPTLVLGYSVKSKGIATDLFGTDKNYVISAQNISDSDDITKAFLWLQKHEADIKAHLQKIMPDYIRSAYDLKEYIQSI